MLFLFDDQRTPIARSVTLSKREIAFVHRLRADHYDEGLSLEDIARNFGLSLVVFEGFKRAKGAIIDDEIWMRPADEITTKINFCHELHHALFAPDAVAFAELDRFRVARIEGKATLCGALFAVRSMPEFTTEPDIYRIFGEMNKDAAFHWINYYRKTGLEI